MVETTNKIYERAMKLFCTLLMIGVMGVPFGGNLPPKVHAKDTIPTIQATQGELLDGLDLNLVGQFATKNKGKFLLTNSRENIRRLFGKEVIKVETKDERTIFFQANETRTVLKRDGTLITKLGKKGNLRFQLNPEAYEMARELLPDLLSQKAKNLFELKNNVLRMHDMILPYLFSDLHLSYSLGKETFTVARLEILPDSHGKDAATSVDIAVPGSF